MSKPILNTVITAALVAMSQSGSASEVTGLTSFTGGTPARATEVNGNFTAVKTAVDNNHARITSLESTAASPNISGNITLVPSTATTGNIQKGTTRFIHDYGAYNTFLGELAGNFTMTGAYNTVSGHAALGNNTSGNSNTASGYLALVQNTTGGQNTACGSQALSNNTTGLSNTAAGASALQNNMTGNNNTANGFAALYSNTTGVGNIAIGYAAGYNLNAGDNNIAIGNTGLGSDSGVIRIGTSGGQIAAFIAGIRGVTTVNVNAIPVVIDSAGQLGTVSSSRRFKDDIANMGTASEVLMKLRPVTFHYKSDRNPAGRTPQYGLIAEEVAHVAPGLVAHSADGTIETVYYQHLTPMLLNEYQKQQRTIAAQARELAALKRQMSDMTAILSCLQQPARVAAVGVE